MFGKISFCLSAALLVCGPAEADLLGAAAKTGSDRLLNWTATNTMKEDPSLAALQAFVSSSSRLGFSVTDPTYGRSGFTLGKLTLRPTAGFDSNANGGNASTHLDLGNGRGFQFAESSLAQGAFMTGLAVSMSARLDYGRGAYVTARAGGSAEVAPESGLVKTSLNMDICSSSHITGWTFFDLCASKRTTHKELSTSETAEFSAAVDQVFNAFDRPMEASLRAFRSNQSGAWTPGIGLSLAAVIDAQNSVSFGVEQELQQTGHAYERYKLSLGLNTRIAKREFRFNVSQKETAGATILGIGHTDITRTASISTRIGKIGMISLSYENTDSTMSFFDAEGFSGAVEIFSMKF